MANVTVSKIIAAPMEKVWPSWDKFGEIQRFNPNVNKSRLINNSVEYGLGAERRCDLSDGKSYVLERVISYVNGRKLALEIYESNLPLKKAVLMISLSPISNNKTKVVLHMDFTPKFGVFGKLLGVVMKPAFRKALLSLLEGNSALVVNGVEIQRKAA